MQITLAITLAANTCYISRAVGIIRKMCNDGVGSAILLGLVFNADQKDRTTYDKKR